MLGPWRLIITPSEPCLRSDGISYVANPPGVVKKTILLICSPMLSFSFHLYSSSTTDSRFRS
ncbi:unnamed protein product [Musa banksii]